MTEKPSFARLVSLAAHDLRTPLATVSGFAKTLLRSDELEEPATRYISMIEAASAQMVELLDELGVAARIEDGRYEPGLCEQDTRALAEGAAEELGRDRVHVSGAGAKVNVDPAATQRAVTALAQCALRHGGLAGLDTALDAAMATKPPRHDFDIAAATPAVARHMSVTGG
jgi:signal transduction histidine kinase